MAIGALFTKQWSGNLWGKNAKSGAKGGMGGMSTLQWLANAAPELMTSGKKEEPENAKNAAAANAPLSYSRRITADFKAETFMAGRDENGEVCYSYEASRQRFEVIINVNGDERNYLIKGTDSEGNSFEKEFDPYEIDPENADYTEFTALCLYIQKTDRYADDVMRNFAQPEDILEKANYTGMLFTWSIEQARTGNTDAFENARKLLVSIQEFTFSRKELELPVPEELIDLLFVERDRVEEKKTEDRTTECTKAVFSGSAPEKPGKVFYTYYSPEGIRCMREGKRNPENPEEKTGEDELCWEIKFENEEQYRRVMQFLSEFPEEDNFLFASKEEFWDDFLSGKVDMDGFRQYYKWTEHGVPNLGVSIDGEEGRFSREKVTDPNAKYFNDQSWIGRVYTEEEMWEQSFQQIGANAPESVKKAWMEAAAAVGADGMGTTRNGMLSHISQLMVQRVLRTYRGRRADDILGSTVQSAVRAVDAALYDLEHPRAGSRSNSPEQIKNREREKKFYQEFLERLRKLL